VEASGQLHFLTALLEPSVSIGRKLGGSQIQSACCGEEKNLLLLLGIEPHFLDCAYTDYATALTLWKCLWLPIEGPPPGAGQTDRKPDSVTFLPYVGSTFNRISRVLARHNIKSVGMPPWKISSFFHLVKDDLGLRTPGVYSIP
jgi:hypothetical protein